jgi:hypothetical protein
MSQNRISRLLAGACVAGLLSTALIAQAPR